MRLPETGERFLGRYEIDEVIGDGGFGRVYRATDTAAARAVAIKILKPGPRGYTSDVRPRFEREVRIVASLRDPHTVTMYDAGESEDGLFFIVSEFVPGADLSTVLAREGRLEATVVVHVLRQLLHALREAHQAGLLHRDIKPENIRIFASDADPHCARLLDFGVARATLLEQDSITRTGELIGTPRYMSPEQLTEQPLSPGSDIYSLGVVALEMLVGSAALPGARWTDQLDRLQSGHQFSFPAASPDAAPLARVIAKMTARDPRDRYPSADAVLRALDDAMSTRPLPAADAAPATPPFAPGSIGVAPHRAAAPDASGEAPRRPPWRLIVAALGGALLLAVVAAVALEHREPDHPSPKPLHRTGAASGLLRSQTPEAPPRAPEPEPEPEPLYPIDGCGQPAPFHGTGTLTAMLKLKRLSVTAHIPESYDGQERLPLIVAFHEDGQRPEPLISQTRLDRLADEEGLLIVAPAGGTIPAWGLINNVDVMDPRRQEQNLELLELARTQLCVDPHRIYAFGHGPGGRAATALGCASPDVAAVATTAYRHLVTGGPCDRAVPQLIISSLRDGKMPVEGGFGCSITNKVALQNHEAAYRDINGCEGEREVVSTPPHGTCYSWSCATPLLACHVDGGRGWPDMPVSTIFDPNGCGGTPVDFPYLQTVWEFFEANPRR